MKNTITKTLFLFFAITLFISKNTSAQTACNYIFTSSVVGTTITFNNTPNVSTGTFSTIDWTLDAVSFSSVNDPILTGVTPGYHVVCLLIVDITCISNPTSFICDTVFVSGSNGISEKDLAKTISVYPNPSNGKVNVVSALINVETITIYNALGEIVFEDKKATLKNELDLATLSNGIYFVKTKTEAGIVTKKLTINK